MHVIKMSFPKWDLELNLLEEENMQSVRFQTIFFPLPKKIC